LYRKVSFTIVLPHSRESRDPSKKGGLLPHPGLTPGLPKVYRSKSYGRRGERRIILFGERGGGEAKRLSGDLLQAKDSPSRGAKEYE